MSWFVEIVLMIAGELCSWRVWLCMGIAAVIVAGFLYFYPEHDGFWSVSYPAAAMVVMAGFWWEYRANRS